MTRPVRPSDRLIDSPLSGPEACLENGMRMPPGKVVSHGYLIDDPPDGRTWFVDHLPVSRDEDDVRDRCDRFLQEIARIRCVFVLRTDDGMITLPAHTGERPITLLFSSAARARTFCTEARFEAEPEEMRFDELLDEYLPFRMEDDGLVGPDWTPDLVGAEIRAALLKTLLEMP